MKLRLRKQRDDRGSTLLMVIIAIVFVGVYGTIIISMAAINAKMKAADRNSRYNFYHTEVALDEIKSGLEEDVADCLAVTYKDILIHYSSMNTAMRKQRFHDKFVEAITNTLIINPTDHSVPVSKLNSYLKETKASSTDGVTPSGDGAKVTGKPYFDCASSEAYLYIRGLRVEYLSEGYITSITTDIRIAIPSDSNAGQLQATFVDYALIGDQGIDAGFTDHTVAGNIYAGSQGLNGGYGKQLNLIACSVITKGDITMKDSGSLSIQGSDLEVWVDNLITSQTQKSDESIGTSQINIAGTCYVRDDLALGACNSNVNLSGRYYGYSGGTGPENNSSIIINAPHAALDLSGLEKLYLAGRAYVSLSDGSGTVNYHQDDAYGAEAGVNSDVLTGESLAVKGGQSAYLLPSRFIEVGHNPVSWNEYIKYYDTLTASDTMARIPTDAVAFDKYSASEQKRYFSYYLREGEPFKRAFYKFGGNDNVVYYYLNFKSQELASEYFNNYVSANQDKITNGFPIQYIKLNTSPGDCITAGNLTTYDSKLAMLRGISGSFTNRYSETFQNLTTSLNKYIRGAGEASQDVVFENIIDVSLLKKDASAFPEGKLIDHDITLGGETYYICVVDNEGRGNYEFNLAGKKGIIIATGNISINRNFTGLVLANGRINLNASEIQADSAMVKKLLSGDDVVSKYFLAYQSDGADSTDIADLITLENWSKN